MRAFVSALKEQGLSLHYIVSNALKDVSFFLCVFSKLLLTLLRFTQEYMNIPTQAVTRGTQSGGHADEDLAEERKQSDGKGEEGTVTVKVDSPFRKFAHRVSMLFAYRQVHMIR